MRRAFCAAYPFWAPDGEHLGFVAEHNLKVVSANGGPPQNVCDVGSVQDARGGAWRSEDLVLFTPDWQTGLFRTLISSCDVKPVTTLEEGESSHRWPEVLPDGEHFIFFSSAVAQKSGLYLGSLSDGRVTRLADATSFAVYAEPGFLVFLRGQTLIDISHVRWGEARGEPGLGMMSGYGDALRPQFADQAS